MTDGIQFEHEMAEKLHKRGFWVHRIVPKADGSQPADIISVKNGRVFLIDCKDCKNNVFPLSRIEDNQHIAMEAWLNAGNSSPWFALRLSDGDVRMINYRRIIQFEKLSRKKQMNVSDILGIGIAFEIWLDM